MPKDRRWTRQKFVAGVDSAAEPRSSDLWLSRGLRAGADPTLAEVMRRGAVHLEGVFTASRLLRSLYFEVCSSVRDTWSRHQVVRNPGGVALRVIAELQELFQVTAVTSTRVDVSERGDFKPRHQDRNAHHADAGNFTCGASFFSSRVLAFAPLDPPEAPDAFLFRQKSGDVFAFDDEVNKLFYHSVPADGRENGFRVSIVLWGTRDPALPLPHGA